MNLPKRIFFTGIPGCGWSTMAQTIERIEGFNTSDRIPERFYSHDSGARHMGAYFGQGMEFSLDLNTKNIDSPWTESEGTRIVKSHDWALYLNEIKNCYPDDWIILVYRPELISLEWWLGAGGFNIKYPNYSAYQNEDIMLKHMRRCNKAMLDFSSNYQVKWSHFTNDWICETFGQQLSDIEQEESDILVTVIK
jgi:hypothetical protein